MTDTDPKDTRPAPPTDAEYEELFQRTKKLIPPRPAHGPIMDVDPSDYIAALFQWRKERGEK